jgi:DNA polymerase-1
MTWTDEGIRGHRLAKTDRDPYEPLRAAQRARDSAVLLIDASGLCYRAFHTREYLEGYDGSRTGVLHGVLQMVRSLCSAANTARWLLVWDGSVVDKRQFYPPYKSRHDRERSPEEQVQHDDMRAQVSLARQELSALGAPSLAVPYAEADDLLGVMAHYFHAFVGAEKGRQMARPLSGVIVVSDDKDLYQTIRMPAAGIGEGVACFRPSAGKLMDREAFVAEFHFEPERYPDYKALVGEPATGDNIPGVSGIGDVTAGKMIANHGSVEKVVAYAKEAAKKPKCPKVYLSVAREIADCQTSYELSRIATDYADLARWSPPSLRHGRALDVKTCARQAFAASVNTRRPCQRAAVDRLRNKLGFIRSFDVNLWESVCGFKVA